MHMDANFDFWRQQDPKKNVAQLKKQPRARIDTVLTILNSLPKVVHSIQFKLAFACFSDTTLLTIVLATTNQLQGRILTLLRFFYSDQKRIEKFFTYRI